MPREQGLNRNHWANRVEPIQMLRPLLLFALLFIVPCCGRPAAHDPASLIHPLIDPAKLATLGDRGTNPRIQKITAILWEAKLKGHDPAVVAGKAVKFIGWEGTPKGDLTVAAMVRNVVIMERLGSTTEEDIHHETWESPNGAARTIRG